MAITTDDPSSKRPFDNNEEPPFEDRPSTTKGIRELRLGANNFRFKFIRDEVSLWATNEFGEPSAIIQDKRILELQLKMLKREFKPDNNSRWKREKIKRYTKALPKEKGKKFKMLIIELFYLLIASGVMKAADDKATLEWFESVLYQDYSKKRIHVNDSHSLFNVLFQLKEHGIISCKWNRLAKLQFEERKSIA